MVEVSKREKLTAKKKQIEAPPLSKLENAALCVSELCACVRYRQGRPELWVAQPQTKSTRTSLPIPLKTSQKEEKQPKVAHTRLLKREKKWSWWTVARPNEGATVHSSPN